MNTIELIKSILKERNIPMSKLEQDLGFSNGFISKERKRSNIDAERLYRIAKYLGVSVEYLITCDDSFSDLAVISSEERELINLFSQLNKEGKELLKQQALFYIQNGYIKNNSNGMAQEA